jgi:signal peptidase I
VNDNPQSPFDDRPEGSNADIGARADTPAAPAAPPTQPPEVSEPDGTARVGDAEPGLASEDDAPDDATKSPSTRKTVIEWVLLVGAALLIALVVKAFLFQAFYIPSDSMVPTLKTHDRVIVNKLSYKLHPVHRGDIIVFKTPKGPDGKPIDPTIKDLIKRVIALPGETVSAQGGRVYINGHPLDEPYLPAGTVTDCSRFTGSCFPKGPLPADEYWVMGDNRQGSRDSRYFGAITKSEIVGRAFLRVWPITRIGLL